MSAYNANNARLAAEHAANYQAQQANGPVVEPIAPLLNAVYAEIINAERVLIDSCEAADRIATRVFGPRVTTSLGASDAQKEGQANQLHDAMGCLRYCADEILRRLEELEARL